MLKYTSSAWWIFWRWQILNITWLSLNQTFLEFGCFTVIFIFSLIHWVSRVCLFKFMRYLLEILQVSTWIWWLFLKMFSSLFSTTAGFVDIFLIPLQFLPSHTHTHTHTHTKIFSFYMLLHHCRFINMHCCFQSFWQWVMPDGVE